MIGDRAATPSPIDFSTDVEVKNKFGAATTKQNLSVTKGASIEDAVQKFCECGNAGLWGATVGPRGAPTQHQSVGILRSVNLNIGSVGSPGETGVRAA